MSHSEGNCKLNLLRLVTLYLDPTPKSTPDWTVQSDDTDVRIIRSWEIDGKLRLLLGAVLPLKCLPDLDAANSIVVPEYARNAAETAIETYAHLVSIGEMCNCSISSPTPWVALLSEDDEARKWLESTNGILQTTRAETKFRFPISPEQLKALLPDRLEGAALLAEALAQSNPAGRFNEFIRVFEHAFRTSSVPLVRPLCAFLSGNGQGYSKDEVHNWITIVRHQTRHADLKNQPTFLLSADVRPYIPRVQQAAFDVLFNKATWHDTNSKRRSLWAPMAFVANEHGDQMVIAQGSTPTIQAQLIDGFGSYPIDLSAHISPVPAHWWCKLADKRTAEQAMAQQDGPANGIQPIRSETNQTSSAAGSCRSPDH
jgi:hypothetical protein